MTSTINRNNPFKLRIPNRNEIWNVFLAVLAPVCLWALLIFSRELPSYLLRMSIWEIIGVLAYIMVIALMDSLLLLFGLLTLALLLPQRVLRVSFSTWGTMFAYGIITAVVLIHLRENQQISISLLTQEFAPWIFAGIFLISVIGLSFVEKSARMLEMITKQFNERISLLSTFFLVITAISIAIVIARNLGFR